MSEKKKKLDPNETIAENSRHRKQKPVLPFKVVIFSDHFPGGTEVLVAKMARTGFLAWSRAPMLPNDVCTVKAVLPITEETAEAHAVVFKTYQRYGSEKAGHDPNHPHLAEFVFQRLSEAGAKAFNHFLRQIDPSTGMPLDHRVKISTSDQSTADPSKKTDDEK